MGTGSSRNQVTIETLPGPPPAADDDADDVVVTRARRQPVRQKTIEKIVTETGAEVGKLKDKQEDILDVTSIHDDDDLEDIQELEQTFDSLGIPSSDDRSKASNDREVPPLRKWNGASLSEDSPKKEVVLDGNPAAVGWSAIRSSSGPQTRLDVPQTTFVNNNNFNNTKSAPTKFTWTSPELPRSKEDWIYQKSHVDGFDPDKFRRVNKKDSSSDEDCSISSRSEDVAMLHPHSIPDYDSSEQQILDSIEKEFVS